MRKTRNLAITFAAIALTAMPGLAQLPGNAELQWDDGGPSGFVSRGGIVASAGLYQKYPADQIAGAVTLRTITTVIQDANYTTPETFNFVLRGNDAAAPGTPNITPGGLTASVTYNVMFGTPTTGTASAALFTFTFPPGIALPAPSITSSSDIYVGVDLPPGNGTTDGCTMYMNATGGTDLGEQFRSTFVGYTGAANTVGLGWIANLTGNAKGLGTGNRAWFVAIRPDQDVLAAFASNAAVFTNTAATGANPNFGYAGFAPDTVRGDGVGLRLRSNAPIGSQVILGYDFGIVTPVNVGVNGNLCLNLATAILFPQQFGTVATTAPNLPLAPPNNTSELVIGPFFGLAGLAGLGNIYAQVGIFDATATGGIRISTVARINL